MKDEKIKEAGFGDLQVVSKRELKIEDSSNKETVKLLSITVTAYKK